MDFYNILLIYMHKTLYTQAEILYLLNGTFPFWFSCFSNQSMISIGVFTGDCIKDTRPEKIVCISLPHTKCNFIHLIQDFVLCTCIQCFMHINQKYVLKIHICRFIFKELTNNTALFLLSSTVWWSPPLFVSFGRIEHYSFFLVIIGIKIITNNTLLINLLSESAVSCLLPVRSVSFIFCT
jgi:hypothetical protein